MFLWNVLSTANGGGGSDLGTWIMLIGAVLIIVVMMVFNSRSQKKRQKEMEETLNSVKPGCKVKTIGGICGVVVEVCKEDNTFVIVTGSDKSGKCFLKLDKQAIYQTDAQKETPAKVEEKAEAPAEEAAEAPEEVFEETTPVEETVEAVAAEESAEETAEASEESAE